MIWLKAKSEVLSNSFDYRNGTTGWFFLMFLGERYYWLKCLRLHGVFTQSQVGSMPKDAKEIKPSRIATLTDYYVV